MESIREQMTGTTVAQKPNQGSPRPLGGIKRRGAFLPARLWHSGGGTLAPVRRESGGGKQKGTKRNVE
jgi:hypothetical protein